MQFVTNKIQESSEFLTTGSEQLTSAHAAHEDLTAHVAAAVPLLEELASLAKSIEHLLGANGQAAIVMRKHLDNALQHVEKANLPNDSTTAENLGVFLAGVNFSTTQIRENTRRAENPGQPMGFAPEYYTTRLEGLQACEGILDKIASNYGQARAHNAASIEASETFIDRT